MTAMQIGVISLFILVGMLFLAFFISVWTLGKQWNIMMDILMELRKFKEDVRYELSVSWDVLREQIDRAPYNAKRNEKEPPDGKPSDV